MLMDSSGIGNVDVRELNFRILHNAILVNQKWKMYLYWRHPEMQKLRKV